MREFFLNFSLWVYVHEKIGNFVKKRFAFIICPNIHMMAVWWVSSPPIGPHGREIAHCSVIPRTRGIQLTTFVVNLCNKAK